MEAVCLFLSAVYFRLPLQTTHVLLWGSLLAVPGPFFCHHLPSFSALLPVAQLVPGTCGGLSGLPLSSHLPAACLADNTWDLMAGIYGSCCFPGNISLCLVYRQGKKKNTILQEAWKICSHCTSKSCRRNPK